MKLLYYPDKSLEIICTEVKDFNEDLWNKLDHMKEIILKHNGLGLAANQVGLTDKMFIMKDIKGNIWEFINPIVVEEGIEYFGKEGCLSFPGIEISIPRSESVVVTALNRAGIEFKICAFELEAVCIQHEMEHLEGKSFLQNLSRQQRRNILRKVKK